MPKTMQEAAQMALDCQNGCNLSGIALAFSEIVRDTLWEEARRLGKGTDWVNRHPICTLFLDKLSDLNGRVNTHWAAAVSEVELIAKGETVTQEVGL